MRSVRPYLSWADGRHWELHTGRWILKRWCRGAPCHLNRDRRHPVRMIRLARAGSARYR